MAPVHDTDVAEERWKEDEWKHLELWEKIEARIQKRKRLWIFLTFMVFLLLSSVPVIMDRAPKWRTQKLARDLALVLEGLKGRAATEHASFQIRLLPTGDLGYIVQEVFSCNEPKPMGPPLQGKLAQLPKDVDRFVFVTQEAGREIKVAGVRNEFCYDFLQGYSPKDQTIEGMGIIPVKDLTEHRLDRLSLVLIEGTRRAKDATPSAEISFN